MDMNGQDWVGGMFSGLPGALPVGTGCWRTVFPSFGVVFGRGVTGKRCDSTVVTRCDSTKK